VFSFALMFANGWLTACDGFYDASACWLSHMKQLTIDIDHCCSEVLGTLSKFRTSGGTRQKKHPSLRQPRNKKMTEY